MKQASSGKDWRICIPGGEPGLAHPPAHWHRSPCRALVRQTAQFLRRSSPYHSSGLNYEALILPFDKTHAESEAGEATGNAIKNSNHRIVYVALERLRLVMLSISPGRDILEQ